MYFSEMENLDRHVNFGAEGNQSVRQSGRKEAYETTDMADSVLK